MTPGERYRYRQQVETLLERIARRTSELRRRSAAGVRAAGMAELKHELARDREALAELVRAA